MATSSKDIETLWKRYSDEGIKLRKRYIGVLF